MNRAEISEFFFKVACAFILLGILIVMGILLGMTLEQGAKFLNIDFLTGTPSRFAHKSGILSPLVGSIYLFFGTGIMASILGVSSAIYLEEIAPKNKLTRIINLGIDTINGIPSILFGLIAADVVGRWMGAGNSLLTGICALSFLSLPPIIVSTRQALNSVPYDVKAGMFALGATKIQTIFKLMLPATYGGILTGIILALSRALGEAAPLIAIGAAAFSPYIPTSIMDEATALPLQIFVWVSRPQKEFIYLASATIIVLLTLIFLLNLTAIIIRYRWRKRIIW